jgi:hypothetical protein
MATELSEIVAVMIAERAAARQADWAARKAAKAAVRTELKAVRDAGLQQRRARKLARIPARPSIT